MPEPARDRRQELLASGAIVWSAALFGTSFVVVKAGLDDVAPVPFVAFRFLAAAAVFVLLARGRTAGTPRELRLGLAAGVSYIVGMTGQTIGLQHIDAAASAFLTYLLAPLVPVILFLTRGRRPAGTEVAALAVATLGLVLLTGGGVGLGIGSVATFVGAVAFAVHLIQVGEAAVAGVEPFRFNMVQSLVVGLGLLPLVPFTGGAPTTGAGWAVVLYAGIFVTVGAFVPWTWAAKHLPPTRTALIFLLEPVFAAMAGYLSGERFEPVAAAGAVLILAGAGLAVLTPGRSPAAPVDAP